jgi:shikimate dehydrogenase
VNLTVPHKVIAFDRVAEIDPAARPVGAVNTLSWRESGWHGFNTDGYGLTAAIRETLRIELKGTSILLLGAGGAARGAAVEFLQRGCSGLWIANRTRETLEQLLTVLARVKGNIPVHMVPLADLAVTGPTTASLPAGMLVINATSAGLKPSDELPVGLEILPRPCAVYDMIYNPPRTRLLKAAGLLDLPHSNGLGMLVHQGAKALEIWSGVPAAKTAATMSKAARAALGL